MNVEQVDLEKPNTIYSKLQDELIENSTTYIAQVSNRLESVYKDRYK